LRDPAIAHILEYLDRGWRNHLISIFQAGIAEESFRHDLDVEATANAMMSQLRGLGFQGIRDADRIDQLVSVISVQTEHWVRAPKPENSPQKTPKKRKP
jgi:hypothetical protein